MQRLVISYDISCPRRRRRANRLLLDHGERVQESVFELLLRPADWRRLSRQLDTLIDPVADQWRSWPLCRADHADTLELGAASPHPKDGVVIV